MATRSDAPPTTDSSPSMAGSRRRPWRWDRVFSAVKTCKHCGKLMQPRVYRSHSGALLRCISETEWNQKMYCSAKCGAQKRRKFRPPRARAAAPWRSARIHSARKICLCCGGVFRPWIKTDRHGNMVSYQKEGDWKRQRFCSISCAKKVENAMLRPAVREKLSRTLRKIGHAPPCRGGNGKLTAPQKQMLHRLGPGWQAEFAVPTRRPRTKGAPTCIKLDIVNPKLRIGIELDGPSHRTLRGRESDQRQMAFLLRNGWRILRISNAKALCLSSTCKSADTLLTTLLGFLHTTVTCSR